MISVTVANQPCSAVARVAAGSSSNVYGICAKAPTFEGMSPKLTSDIHLSDGCRRKYLWWWRCFSRHRYVPSLDRHVSTDGLLAFPELSAAGDHGIPSLQAKPDFAICMSGGTACAPYAPITSSASAAAEAATFTHIPISVAVVLAHSRPESFNPEISRVINVNPRLEHGLQVA